MVKITVTKTGTVVFGSGTYYMNQGREIFVIGKMPPKENVAGTFQKSIPENFDLWGGNAVSRKLVTAILARAKKISKKKTVKKKKFKCGYCGCTGGFEKGNTSKNYHCRCCGQIVRDGKVVSEHSERSERYSHPRYNR